MASGAAIRRSYHMTRIAHTASTLWIDAVVATQMPAVWDRASVQLWTRRPELCGSVRSWNTPGRLRDNARTLGVADRVRLHEADISRTGLPDACAEVFLSSLSLHDPSDATAGGPMPVQRWNHDGRRPRTCGRNGRAALDDQCVVLGKTSPRRVPR